MAEPTKNIGLSQPDDGSTSWGQQIRDNNSKLDTAIGDHETRLDTAETTIADHETRLDAAEPTIADHETRLDTAEGTISGQGTRLSTAETTISNHGTRLGAAETTIGDHETRIDSLEAGAGTPGDAVSIHGKSVKNPVSADSGKVLSYDSATNSYIWVAAPTGSGGTGGTTGTSGPIEIFDDFETEPLKWDYGTWIRTTEFAHSGTYSLRAPDISGNGSTEFTLSFENVEAGTLSFWWLTQSETSYDWLQVFIDEVKVLERSGQNVSTFTEYTTTLSVGRHSVRFRYSKDGSGDTVYDTVYIDNLRITGIKDPNAVDAPAGSESTGGSSAWFEYIAASTVLSTSGYNTKGILFEPKQDVKVLGFGIYEQCVTGQILRLKLFEVGADNKQIGNSLFETADIRKDTNRTTLLVASLPNPITFMAGHRYVAALTNYTVSGNNVLAGSAVLPFDERSGFVGDRYVRIAATDPTSGATWDIGAIGSQPFLGAVLIETTGGSGSTGGSTSPDGTVSDANAVSIQSVPVSALSPTAADDGKVLTYDAVSGSFVLKPKPTGGGDGSTTESDLKVSAVPMGMVAGPLDVDITESSVVVPPAV